MDPDRAPLACRLRDAFEVVNTPVRHVQDLLRFPVSERRWLRAVRASIAQRPEVVMVYSAPKTASTSVADAIERTNAFTVIKVHHLQPAFFWPGVASPIVTRFGGVRHRAIEQRTTRSLLPYVRGPIKTVSMIRDPIAFNLSNFTFFGRGYWMRTRWRSAPWMTPDELFSRFRRDFPVGASDAWWTHEFRPTTGIDPLNEPFDAERGWQVLRSDRFECLLLRTDVPESEKTDALRSFLGRTDVPPIARLNPNAVGAPPALIERLSRAIGTHPDYVDRALGLPAALHFWTDRQRAVIRECWLRQSK